MITTLIIWWTLYVRFKYPLGDPDPQVGNHCIHYTSFVMLKTGGPTADLAPAHPPTTVPYNHKSLCQNAKCIISMTHTWQQAHCAYYGETRKIKGQGDLLTTDTLLKTWVVSGSGLLLLGCFGDYERQDHPHILTRPFDLMSIILCTIWALDVGQFRDIQSRLHVFCKAKWKLVLWFRYHLVFSNV